MKIRNLLLASALTVGGVTAANASPASAASACSSWGCGTATVQTSPDGGYKWWNMSVTDTKTDGYCVEIWSVRAYDGVRLQRAAVSCGGTVYGSTVIGVNTERVRVYRGDGSYFTVA